MRDQWIINLGGSCREGTSCSSLCYQKRIMGNSHMTVTHLLRIGKMIDKISKDNATIGFHINHGTPETTVRSAYTLLVRGTDREWGATVSNRDIAVVPKYTYKDVKKPLFMQASIMLDEPEAQDLLYDGTSDYELTGYSIIVPNIDMKKNDVKKVINTILKRKRIEQRSSLDKKIEFYVLAEHNGEGCTKQLTPQHSNTVIAVFDYLKSCMVKKEYKAINRVALDSCVANTLCQAKPDSNVYNVFMLKDGSLSVGGCPWNAEIRHKDKNRGIFSVE